MYDVHQIGSSKYTVTYNHILTLKDGPKTVDQLAALTGAHPQSLYRLLRMLAGYGVFAENRDGHFELTPAAQLLQTGALRDVARIRSNWSPMNHVVAAKFEQGGRSYVIQTEPRIDCAHSQT